MMAFIQAHILAVGVPLALVAGLGAALKALPTLLDGKVIAALDYLFTKGDAADDRLIAALISWADSKYGNASGAVKAAFVVDHITAMLPLQYRAFMSDKARAKAVELFQACFDRVEAAAIKEAKDHTPPLPAIIPPVPPIVSNPNPPALP